MGDGHDDLIVGAWRGDDGGSDAGEAYILYGMASNVVPGHQFVGSELVRTGAGDDSVRRRVLDTTNLDPVAGFIIQGDRGSDAGERLFGLVGLGSR